MVDVSLVNLWTEPVFVLPSYAAVRQEIRECWRILAKRRLAAHLSTRTDMSAYWDMTRYSTSLPISNGLLSIGAMLATNGIHAAYVNLESERRCAENKPEWLEAAVQKICRNTSIAVGVSVLTHDFQSAMKFLAAVKREAPRLKTFVGGAHGSFLDMEVAESDIVDAVVRFEGEATAVDLIKTWQENGNLNEVNGITFRENGKVVRNPDRVLIDLSTLPLPAYDLVDQIALQDGRITTAFSRGCDSRCVYCAESAFWHGGVRYKDPARFAQELRVIAEQVGQRFIHISDSTFGLDRKAVSELCDNLEREPIDALFSVNIRYDVFDYMGEELLKRLLQVGFVEFALGLETSSDTLTRAWGRPQTMERLLKTLEKLKSLHIPLVAVYTFIGGPGDTAESLQHTINTVQFLLEEELIFYAMGKFFMPTPGTPVFNNPEKYGYRIMKRDHSWFDRHSFPLPYIHENLSQFEILHYLALFQSVQLAHYIKMLGGEEDFIDRFRNYAERHFLQRIYL